MSVGEGQAPDQEIRSFGDRLSNWGAWGPDDEIGALNYAGVARVVRAAGLVQTGEVISLSIPIQTGVGPQDGSIGRFNPVHTMTWTGNPPGPIDMGAGADFCDGLIVMPTQGTTQWDALCHTFYDGKIYNGRRAADIGPQGSPHAHIAQATERFVGRGVLLDVAGLLDVQALDTDYSITSADLSACCARQGVDVGEGDFVLIRTGMMSRVRSDDWTAFRGPQPGLEYQALEWCHEHRIAAIASDNTSVEVYLKESLRGIVAPLHRVALRDMGLHLGELWSLEELALACSGDERYDFMLVAQPLRIVGGSGSPVNPLAIR
jgi:kynurenine formamidase